MFVKSDATLLTPAKYDAAETAALRKFGYAQISAFRSKTYEDHGFPTRMLNSNELWRYADNIFNHDSSRQQPDRFFRTTPLFTRFTLDERDLIQRIGLGVSNLIMASCGKKYQARYALLGAIGLFRVIDAIKKFYGKETYSLFEAGPGTGYTGLMLALDGHKYISYDVTQATYIWQSELFRHFLGEEFLETATLPAPEFSARVVHLPWWQLTSLYKNCPIQADLILSNANLAEMHPLSLKYLLRLGREILLESDIGMLIFASVGGPHMNSYSSVQKELNSAGFKPVLSEKVFAYVLRERDVPTEFMESLEERIPFFDPSLRGGELTPDEVVDFGESGNTLEQHFWHFSNDTSGV